MSKYHTWRGLVLLPLLTKTKSSYQVSHYIVTHVRFLSQKCLSNALILNFVMLSKNLSETLRMLKAAYGVTVMKQSAMFE